MTKALKVAMIAYREGLFQMDGVYPFNSHCFCRHFCAARICETTACYVYARRFAGSHLDRLSIAV